MKFFVFSFAFLLGWDGVGWKYLDAILNELSRKKTIVLFCALYQFCKIAFQCERLVRGAWPGCRVSGHCHEPVTMSRIPGRAVITDNEMSRPEAHNGEQLGAEEQIINALEVEQIQSPLLPDTF